MLLEENKPLAPFTTFGIGGPARWYVEAATEEEIVEAAEWAREQGTELFVLGGGSNLLVADAGFNGLVLRIALMGITVAYTPPESTHFIYEAAAGESWEHCLQRTIEDSCAGLECLAGIPGTVGGTPVQNVGAYGQEVASAIVRVRAYDLTDRAFVEFTNAECGFSYRRSRFNTTDRGRYIVTRVDFRLTLNGAPTLRYADLQKAFADRTPEAPAPTLAEVAAVVRRVRQSKGMLLVDGDPDCRSAGSFFKNPIVFESQLAQIAGAASQPPPRFPAGPEAGRESSLGQVKVPAAWLIEQAGFAKGYKLGAAAISSKHTLALVNFGHSNEGCDSQRTGSATATEILALAGQITAAVEAKFQIRLQMEPVMLGF
jgi:UDP-N-acetylmuramate dehydrogenase